MSTRARFFALALGFFGLVGAGSVAEAQSVKIAIVDVEAVMNSTDHWKKVVASLQKERAEKQAMLETKQKELRDKKEKLDAQKAVSDPAALAPQEATLYKDAQELTGSFMKTQQELTEREKRATDSMLKRIEVIVQDLAHQGQYDFVFEKGSAEDPNVLYTPAGLDITARVVEEYKKRFKDQPIN